ACGAIAGSARPRLFAVPVAAAAPCVGVLDFLQREVRFPVLALLRQGRRAVADFHPLHAAIGELPRLRHVPEVFVARDRSSAEGAIVDRLRKRGGLSWFHTRRYEIPHGSIVVNGGTRLARPWTLSTKGAHTVARMTFSLAIAAAALAASSSARAQQVRPDDSFQVAAQLIGELNADAGGEQIAALKRDFNEFAAAYQA